MSCASFERKYRVATFSSHFTRSMIDSIPEYDSIAYMTRSVYHTTHTAVGKQVQVKLSLHLFLATMRLSTKSSEPLPPSSALIHVTIAEAQQEAKDEKDGNMFHQPQQAAFIDLQADAANIAYKRAYQHYVYPVVSFLSENDKANSKAVVHAMLLRRGMIAHHIESFERFMLHWIPHIVRSSPAVSLDFDHLQRRHVVEFKDVTFTKPDHREASGIVRPVYPHECKKRKLTYASTAFMDAEYRIYDISAGKDQPKLCETRLYREVPIGQFPVITRSPSFCRLSGSGFLNSECPLDSGGLFVVNGVEKVLISQDKKRMNHATCYRPKKDALKYGWECEVRSCSETKLRSTSTLYAFTALESSASPDIVLRVPFILNFDVPLAAVLRILGVTSAQDAERMILDGYSRKDDPTDQVCAYVRAACASDLYQMEVRELYDWIARQSTDLARKYTTSERRTKVVENIFNNEFLPHVGMDRTPETLRKKRCFTGKMLRTLLLTHFKQRKADDPDHFGNKRVEPAGTLLAYLFRPLFRKAMRSFTAQLKKAIEAGKPIHMADLFSTKTITVGIRRSLSSGEWGVQRGGAGSRTGVSQQHNRLSLVAGVSNLRLVNTHVNKDGRMPQVRKYHMSHDGIFCPTTATEGPTCGLVKSMAMSCHIRTGYDVESTIDNITQTMGDVVRTIEQDCKAKDDDHLREEAKDDERVGADRQTQQQEEEQISNNSGDEQNIILYANWIPVGFLRKGVDPWNVVGILRRKRLRQVLPFDTTIYYNEQEKYISVEVDAGCCMRPLFVLQQLHKLPRLMAELSDPCELWSELLLEGVIEYVDKTEERMYRVAKEVHEVLEYDAEQPFTHVELHPSLMLANCASLIPFPDHNQSPRNTYQCAMGKQAMATPFLSAQQRWDTLLQFLCYPDQSAVQTFLEEEQNLNMLPTGEVIEVAIMPWTGYNQEDSTIVDQGAVDMGFGQSMMVRCLADDEGSKSATTTVKFGKPSENCRGLQKANYSKIGERGVVEPGTWLMPGDAVMTKIITATRIVGDNPVAENMPDSHHHQSSMAATAAAQALPNKKEKEEKIETCSTVIWRETNDPGMVVDVIETTNRDGAKMFRVKVASMRRPEIGDKFSSRHGQKGTLGMFYRREDMPYDYRTGKTPVFIINMHCIPRRMTIGMLIEMLLGQVGAAQKQTKPLDGTPFGNLTYREMMSKLKQAGFAPSGKRTMMNPYNGKLIETPILVCPVTYQRLKHTARDKNHARARGPRQILTRQPAEGRARDGGLRMGEMERDCLIAHGAPQTAKDRLFVNSDPYIAHVCGACGLLAEPPRPADAEVVGFSVRASKPYCRHCDAYDTVEAIKMPYVAVLYMNEMMAGHLRPKMFIKKATPPKKRARSQTTEDENATDDVIVTVGNSNNHGGSKVFPGMDNGAGTENDDDIIVT